MKFNFPFYTPKQIIETNRLMRDVKNATEPIRMAKQMRHNAYLSHSYIGYTPPELPKKNLHKILGDFFRNIKCKFLKCR